MPEEPTQSTNSHHQLVPQKPRLSPTARYHICKLLRQPSGSDSAKLLEFKAMLSKNNCAQLDGILHEIYADEAKLSQVMIQLDNLTYFYTILNSQYMFYPNSARQMMRIKQEILQLIGFSEI
ncbi:MAG: hypothetical protein HC827_09290 [Cyanobacteria bacterium RM1_2_2]|nr:hypothetical protein [Cyanobacteria bacterium RM1_2_2]